MGPGVLRRFLKAADLRTLGRSAEYLVFQTNDEDVARTKILLGTRTTNPGMPEDVVCLFNGFMPENYGRFHVIFERNELTAYPANPPEWRVIGHISSAGVGYTTTDELVNAGLISVKKT
jgi:hypothetical protein